jgi:thioredoxin reductase (NADPH)
MSNNIYDVVIIGSGAAGASAAIYSTRFNLKTLMLGGPMPGGLITEASDVENYPGFLSITGMQLAGNFVKQATALGAEYRIELANTVDQQIEGSNPVFKVSTGTDSYMARSVILAMGTHHRKLNIPGEFELAGRGVSYCATCDAPFYKNKIVAISGGGNSAVEAAQDLSVHASKVYLIYRSELKAAPVYIDQLRKKSNVVEVPGTNILEISGQSKVESVKLDKPFEGSDIINVDGVFIQIGYSPKNELAKSMGLNLTEYGYVKVDQGMGTNVKGVFCAGDLNNSSNMLHQQITSAAEGAIAAQSVYRYLSGVEYIVNG